MKIIDALRQNLALSLTGLALALFVLGLAFSTARIFSGPDSLAAGGVTPNAREGDSERELLLRRRVWLMARINLCRQESEVPFRADRSVCPPDERARLPEYEQKIVEIDRLLGKP